MKTKSTLKGITLNGEWIACKPGAEMEFGGVRVGCADSPHICKDCHAERLVPHPGDVAMCTQCWWWWARAEEGPTLIFAHQAAELAREPMTLEEITAALASAEQAMEIMT